MTYNLDLEFIQFRTTSIWLTYPSCKTTSTMDYIALVQNKPSHHINILARLSTLLFSLLSSNYLYSAELVIIWSNNIVRNTSIHLAWHPFKSIAILRLAILAELVIVWWNNIGHKTSICHPFQVIATLRLHIFATIRLPIWSELVIIWSNNIVRKTAHT